MEAIVKKWGNSLGIRFPKVYADETGIFNGSRVNIKIRDGKLVIEPIHEDEKSLNELLKAVTKENIHHEFDSGNIGEELW